MEGNEDNQSMLLDSGDDKESESAGVINGDAQDTIDDPLQPKQAESSHDIPVSSPIKKKKKVCIQSMFTIRVCSLIIF